MNYSRIYESLIQHAKDRVPEGYIERHHIVPRCMGGSDENENLVALTPEEHFTAHVLLVKMYPENTPLIKAVQKMCQGKQRKRNKMYGWLKRRFSEEMKRSQSGSGNSQHGLMWVCNIETKQNKKVPKDQVLEEGWVKGRNRWNRIKVKEKKYSRQALAAKHALENSNSISEAIRSLGLQTRGGNYSRFKKFAEQFGLKEKFVNEKIKWDR